MRITGTVERLLYTPEEAAEALCISRCKVYELITEGQLYSVKIGRCRRIPVEALRRYVEKLSSEAA